MEGTSFGEVPLNMELKLEVWDSPNSAGIVIDAVRLAKLALNNGVAGGLEGPSSYLMKSPPKQIPGDDAYEATERFIKQNARRPAAAPAPASACGGAGRGGTTPPRPPPARRHSAARAARRMRRARAERDPA